MSIQLKGDPQIRINGEELEGYSLLNFKMSKRLLEPNRMEFTMRKKDMTLTHEDIKFELRTKLLGALVECSVKANRREIDGNWVTDEINDFFRGYIQHINLVRAENKNPLTIRCVAYSPDARLKMFPNCKSFFDDRNLKNLVEWIFQEYSEDSKTFNDTEGKYYSGGEEKKNLEVEVNPNFEETIPYIVQYHENDYDFLVRMAKRFGEFFYYEDGKVVFGKMVEHEPINMRTGYDIESYNYDLNMSQHTGIVLTEYDHTISTPIGIGSEKGTDRSYGTTVEPIHEMSKTVYERSTDFFNNQLNQVADLRSTHINPKKVADYYSSLYGSSDPSGLHDGLVVHERRLILDKYVMADTLICHGKSRRADLKLGSVIVIEDETNLGWQEKTDIVQHEPLKVIDLTYEWNPEKDILTMNNDFKAIPQKSLVPPYLERDENGFLTYGDFDIFPHSGPQHGVVVDTDDPDHEGKVRVVLDWQLLISDSCFSGHHSYDDACEMFLTTPWIRVSQAYAGSQRHGTYLIPEKGDEVIVGFEHNNVERPYVMGSLYNKQANHAANEWLDSNEAPNEFKSIRTRNGHTVEIRDKGEHGYIKIYDNDTHNYVVTYDTDKKLIRLESKGNIELDARNNIVLHAGQDLIMNVDNDMKTNVKHDKNDTIEHDQHFEITGNNTSYTRGYQAHRAEDNYFISGGSSDDHPDGISYLNLELKHWTGLFSPSYSKDNGSFIRMDEEKIEMSTSMNGTSLELASKKGGDVKVSSDMKNVAVNAGANVSVEATGEATVKGAVVKIN